MCFKCCTSSLIDGFLFQSNTQWFRVLQSFSFPNRNQSVHLLAPSFTPSRFQPSLPPPAALLICGKCFTSTKILAVTERNALVSFSLHHFPYVQSCHQSCGWPAAGVSNWLLCFLILWLTSCNIWRTNQLFYWCPHQGDPKWLVDSCAVVQVKTLTINLKWPQTTFTCWS